MPAQSQRNERVVNLHGQNTLLPHVLKTTKHVQVKTSVSHKRIVILVGSQKLEHAEQLLDYALKLWAFATEEEIHHPSGG